jgi:hypothetical protein
MRICVWGIVLVGCGCAPASELGEPPAPGELSIAIGDAEVQYQPTLDYAVSVAFTATYDNDDGAAGDATITHAALAFPGGEWAFHFFLEPKNSGVVGEGATVVVDHSMGMWGEFTPYAVVPDCDGTPPSVPLTVRFDTAGVANEHTTQAAFTCTSE